MSGRKTRRRTKRSLTDVVPFELRVVLLILISTTAMLALGRGLGLGAKVLELLTATSQGAFGESWSCEQAIGEALRSRERAIEDGDAARAAELEEQLEQLVAFCATP